MSTERRCQRNTFGDRRRNLLVSRCGSCVSAVSVLILVLTLSPDAPQAQDKCEGAGGWDSAAKCTWTPATIVGPSSIRFFYKQRRDFLKPFSALATAKKVSTGRRALCHLRKLSERPGTANPRMGLQQGEHAVTSDVSCIYHIVFISYFFAAPPAAGFDFLVPLYLSTMTHELARWRKLSQFMPHHIFRYEDRQMGFTIMNTKCQSQHHRRDR